MNVAVILQMFGYAFSQLVAVFENRAERWANHEKLTVEIRSARSCLLPTVEFKEKEQNRAYLPIKEDV